MRNFNLGVPAFWATFLVSLFSGSLLAQTNTFPSSGNVGIGTTSPSSALHIKDPSGGAALDIERGGKKWNISIQNTGNNLFLSNSFNSSFFFTFANNGRFGIGTTSPREELEVNGDILLTSEPANSSNTLNHSTGIRFMSSGHASDGRTRYQDWKVQSNARSVWGSGDLVFLSNTDGAGYSERLRIRNDGKIGIGTTSPDSKLTVKGNIHAEEVKVDLSVPGPDYVFKEEYDLKSLEEVQNYINEHGHLPNIPSAKDMEENGVQLGVMNMRLLEKIEELTLYVLEQQREIKLLHTEMNMLKEKNN